MLNASSTSSLNTAYSSQLKRGAHLIDSEHTQFCLWAPEATQVSVIFESGEEFELSPDGEFPDFYVGTVTCGVGTRYKYNITNKQNITLLVPDPASRGQAESVHGYSIVIDEHSYHWRQVNWTGRPWHETVLYEMHVGVFEGFIGVKSKLAELAAMGFTAIMIMPIACFPGQRNWGYDGVLLYAPHFSYGSADDLKSLIDEAHTLNLSIYLDVVYNHFGPDGNYLHHYAPQFFDEKEHTLWGKAINLKHPIVRSFFTENVLYWLEEFQFDGLRFDACHAIYDKSWLFEVANLVQETIGAKRYINLMAENDDNSVALLQNGFSAQWNDDAHHLMHVLLTGETEGYYSYYAENTAQNLAKCLSQGFVFSENENLYKEASNRLSAHDTSRLSPTSFVFFLQNHDQIGNRPFGERLTTLVLDRTLRVANALVLLCPHIPMIFMGEEFGATQPFLYFTSHEDEALIEAIRQGRRKQFASFSKFADSTFALKIPDSNDVDTFETSIPRPISVEGYTSASNWSQWMSKLLAIRHAHITPKLATAKSISAKAIGPSAVVVSWRMSDGSKLILAFNLGNEILDISQQALCVVENSDVLFDYSEVWESLTKNIFPGNSIIALSEAPINGV
ncbi:MAG: malto-oligosyltrehalose trehalohydrolase [Methylotenera sp.]|uniref:malto-oligosyltrehalose trehalohydrolase n=1 Tax=Methylotenera sp. TaxID=2051956 RepID=UPI002487AD50|nr:malto-oligosyltrehalose trehalohydrolase [Methylotenera sp.]MDI1308851.1 malto-oligosyltrehalose trehalohydrolase [Methylotenera sp.]